LAASRCLVNEPGHIGGEPLAVLEAEAVGRFRVDGQARVRKFVEVATEVLQQDERDVAATEVAIRVLDPVLGLDPLSRGVGIGD